MPISIIPPPAARDTTIIDADVDRLAEAFEKQSDTDFLKNIVEVVFSVALAAKVFNSSVLSVGKAAAVMNKVSTSRDAAILNDANMDADRAASILNSTNITVDKVAAILNDTGLSVDKAASILNSVNLAVSRAALILVNANITADRVAAVLNSANITASRVVDIFADPNMTIARIRSIAGSANISGSRLYSFLDTFLRSTYTVFDKFAAMTDAGIGKTGFTADDIASLLNDVAIAIDRILKLLNSSELSPSNVSSIFSSANLGATRAKDLIDGWIDDESLTNFDNIASAIEAAIGSGKVTADDVAAKFESTAVSVDRLASIINSSYLSVANAVSILISANLSRAKAFLIFFNPNVVYDRRSDIWTSLATSDRQALMRMTDIDSEITLNWDTLVESVHPGGAWHEHYGILVDLDLPVRIYVRWQFSVDPGHADVGCGVRFRLLDSGGNEATATDVREYAQPYTNKPVLQIVVEGTKVNEWETTRDSIHETTIDIYSDHIDITVDGVSGSYAFGTSYVKMYKIKTHAWNWGTGAGEDVGIKLHDLQVKKL